VAAHPIEHCHREDILGVGQRSTVCWPNTRKERVILRVDPGRGQEPVRGPYPRDAPTPFADATGDGRRDEAANSFHCNVIASVYTPLSHRVDLSARLAQLPRTFEADARRADALAESVRQAHETLEPRKVAAWLVGRLQVWVPLASWTVLEDDLMGPPRALATGPGAGDAPTLVASVASRVIRLGEELVTPNLQSHLVSAPAVAAMALPLVARGAVIGAVVGPAGEPAATPPVYEGAVRRTLALLLDPAAVALDNARRMAQAEALSVTDDLTRLFNARFLKQALTRELKRSVRSGRPLSLIFLDLDGFKGVNDRYGHLRGSRTLVEFAGILRSCARETDVLARYGGDEFALVLPETDPSGAQSVAERIRARVAEFSFLASEGLDVRLTTSIGFASRDSGRQSVTDLLRAADEAMYWVKAHGKNGIHGS
jgi:diguanylate cyclase (GGDEF)-like protein